MYYDVIISGGGLLGLITAIGLKRKSLSVALLEKNDISHPPKCDNRVFAISYNTKKLLENFGIWHFIESEAEPILDICILDENSPISLHYDHKIISKEPMGYVVKKSVLQRAVSNNLTSEIHLYSPTSYKSISCNFGCAEVVLDNGQELTSQLLICAEGRHSKLRELFFLSAIKFQYKQSSIVCNVEHEKHHQCLAVERFFPGCPFAILPMKGGYKSSIVWTEKSDIISMLMNLSNDEFIIELKKRFGSYLGDIKLENDRVSYPLFFLFSKALYKKRIVLIGDVAHSIHPIAGQGLNLGIKDVESIVANISTAREQGIDVGSKYVLEKYSSDRYFDNCTMAVITDGLNRLFSNRNLCTKVFRNTGLLAVENFTPFKKFFISHAMGMSSRFS
ncbi:MAG: 2-octaprenyl-3-methyl-6-methoxy-1,4-benzoquinol hydroxylase [Candidatus Mesenet longicola]|uniref:2-octaprenyl-3-methyl-6-methoxy-1,4-benzoquinol hydroxylase n=1 Tax=Candidatus Mesenet longicola TaxID=1892558 RepID=A0A8J3HPW2_9RICK|nr:MAG: 2-octaprenyl-3-methyl-6-methoxy-1,4-benzoquinol hydroxylase [Candidatus Mesenet longicola]GHM59661.1 MAG: 2-octaprenyl-3-methyl-6-methoxy-1,4-benzoquinol hydroxylase [Candidatus Mesenet longicola]